MLDAVVSLTERPDLAPLVAEWRVRAFFDFPGGYTVEAMTAALLRPAEGPEETFVAMRGGEPVGTAGLMRHDMESRRDLTPWLAGLFVVPDCRGMGIGTGLVRTVEGFAAAAGVEVVWLYTVGAVGFYLRLGWVVAGVGNESGYNVTIMQRRVRGAYPGESEDKAASKRALMRSQLAGGGERGC